MHQQKSCLQWHMSGPSLQQPLLGLLLTQAVEPQHAAEAWPAMCRSRSSSAWGCKMLWRQLACQQARHGLPSSEQWGLLLPSRWQSGLRCGTSGCAPRRSSRSATSCEAPFCVCTRMPAHAPALTGAALSSSRPQGNCRCVWPCHHGAARTKGPGSALPATAWVVISHVQHVLQEAVHAAGRGQPRA